MSYISGCKLILGGKRRRISLADERSDVAGAPRRAKKRTRIVRPYPNCTLEEAVTVAAAIQEANSGLPFDRVLLAEELGTTTRSSGFTIRLNAAARYGLTQGAYNDDSIALTPRGQSVVAPTTVEEREMALIEAALAPEPFERFFRLLDRRRMPPDDTHAENLLQREVGIAPGLTTECLGILRANGLYAGILKSDIVTLPAQSGPGANPVDQSESAPTVVEEAQLQPRRVFVGHAGEGEPIDLVKDLLDRFAVPHRVVDIHRASDDRGPVSRAAADEMRRCSAAIMVLSDAADGSRATGSMLCHVGAASVLYGDHVVLLDGSDGRDIDESLNGLTLVVDFDAGNPAQAGLGLLQALSQSGVLKISV